MSSKCKIFRDPVHGDIQVDDKLCRDFIDTPVFQRLRGIEQTSSLRWLFPGARHDRFIHSLGVYHLANQIYNAIERNTVAGDGNCSLGEVGRILSDKKLKRTFLVAALMHDCGHAPFSHTTESFYNWSCEGNDYYGDANQVLNRLVGKAREKEFALGGTNKGPADHEVMSAAVLLSKYSGKADGEFDPQLAARMIIGKFHGYDNTERRQVENILIRLINGTAIDVDKLDYILRDTWATGVKNVSVDMGRLLDAALISRNQDGKLILAYQAKAMSAIQSAVDARNHIYEWVCGHHTVVYYSEVLKRLCVVLGQQLANKANASAQGTTANSVIRALFSYDSIFTLSSDKASACNESCYLMNDGDLQTLFKQYCSDDWAFKSYTSHVPEHIPLWKSEADYKAILGGKAYQFGEVNCADVLCEHFGLTYGDDCMSGKGTSDKIYDIKSQEVMVKTRDGAISSYCNVANQALHPQLAENQHNPFFYLFVRKEHREKIPEMINFIKNYNWV